MAGARPAGISRVVRRCRGSLPMPSRVSKAVAVWRRRFQRNTLVEIAAQMGAAQAMEGSERPALQVREHTMDPRQHEMGERCTDDLGLVVVDPAIVTGRGRRCVTSGLPKMRSGLLRCGTVGWPHRSRPGPQAGCDPGPWHGAACVAGARHSCNLGLELQGGDTVRVAGPIGAWITGGFSA